jgi:hypothetical protein
VKEKFRHGHLLAVGWDISGPGFQEIAHSADAQISTISTPATAIRCGAESRISEGAIVGAGWVAPLWWWWLIM